MSRTTIMMDSLIEADMRTLLLAFHRTRDFGIPPQGTTECTIRVEGSCYTVTLPALNADRAAQIMAIFNHDRIEAIHKTDKTYPYRPFGHRDGPWFETPLDKPTHPDDLLGPADIQAMVGHAENPISEEQS